MTKNDERKPTNVTIHPFMKRTTPLIINFADKTVDNRSEVVNNFYALHKQWGGYSNGGVVAENIYMLNNNLILEAHGDIYEDYDGVQGVNSNMTLKFDTIKSNGKWGDNPNYGKPWVRRVGSCLVTKDYFGYGRFLVRAMIPKLVGVAPAWWSFHYT